MIDASDEIAAQAARWVVEEGLEYGPAKQRAAKQLGLTRRAALPSNELLEEAIREYISVFCADTQAQELAELRRLALVWMVRLAEFRPYLAGSVWRGTATRNSDIYLHLFCDDSKSAEIALIDQKVTYIARTVNGFAGKPIDTLSVHAYSSVFSQEIGVHLMIYDYDDVRGALKPDAQGRTLRGDAEALRGLIDRSTL